MNEQVQNFLNVCKGIWSSLGNFQKSSIIAIGLICAISLGAVIYYGSQPKMHPLYVDVDSKTMMKIRDILEEDKIPYELTNGGKTVKIPHQYINEMRLKVSSDSSINLESNDQDVFAYIDNMPMGTASSEKLIKFEQALAKKLELQIAQMPKIQKSKVTLQIPRKRAFETQKESTASVLLNVKRGEYISPTLVTSIRHLVSSAVSNLKPDNVTVIDTNGRTLAARSIKGVSTSITNGEDERRREVKAEMENKMQQKIHDLLEPVIGKGRVIARVNIDLDFEKEQTTSEKLGIPGVLTKKVTSEQVLRPSQSGGPVGVAANQVKQEEKTFRLAELDQGGTGTPVNSGVMKSIEDLTNYIPKTTSIVYKEGSIIKSVSVAVNIASRKDKPWGALKLTEFESLISSAVGLVRDDTTGRMDTVKVVENEFEAPVPKEIVQKVAVKDLMDNIDSYLGKPFVKNIMGALLLIILLLFYKKIFAAEKIESQEVSAGNAEGTQIMTEEDAEQSELLKQAEVARLEAQKASEEMAIIKDATEHEPQCIAAVLESWVMKEADI